MNPEIKITHAGSRLWKWEFEWNGGLYFGWEETEDDAIHAAQADFEALLNGEEVGE